MLKPVASSCLFVLAGLIVGRLSSTPALQYPMDRGLFGESLPTTTSPSPRHFWTVGEIKKNRMVLPCNFVHDGYYIRDSNEVVNQVYQSLMELDDDIVPFIIEAGGHDGITKSISLKSSRCLGVNTLLIDASPNNYKVLHQTRSYDRTVHAALCEDVNGVVPMRENARNSGENKIIAKGGNTENTIQVPCTSLDAELDKIRDLLPDHEKDKLQLIFMVLDIEGFEAVATKGLTKHRPHKLMMEWKNADPKAKEWLEEWAKFHNITGKECGQDHCFNYHPMIGNDVELTKKLFYGARKMNPQHSWETSKVSKAYYFYGE